MVIKSAFGGGPIAVDFMWSSGTGSEDGFASPPSPMFALLLLLLLVFHNARARLKSVGDPTKWNKNTNISPHYDRTSRKRKKKISPRVLSSLSLSLSFALKLGEERDYNFSRPPAKFRRL